MEQVFVVPRAAFFGGDWPQGFLDGSQQGVPDLAALSAVGFFAPREQAEREPAWKQLIPYCVLRRPGMVFCVQRKQAQSEARLHNSLSIGIGGHINPEDGERPSPAEDFFDRSLLRELTEELDWGGAAVPGRAFQGMLNDDSTEVGSVHCGLVYAIDLGPQEPGCAPVRIREVSKMAGGFRLLAELAPLWQDPNRFETWSRILFQAGIAGKNAVTRAQRTLSARPIEAQRNAHG